MESRPTPVSRKLKASTLLSLALAASILGLTLAAPAFGVLSTVSSSVSTATNGATGYDYQTHAINVTVGHPGLFWAFASTGSALDCFTSNGGTTWSAATAITTSGSVATGAASSFFDPKHGSGQDIAYVETSNGASSNFYVRQGTVSGSGCGSITWTYAEVTVAATGTTGLGATITVDSGGILYAAIPTTQTGVNHVEVWKCSATCGTASNWSKVKDVTTESAAGTVNAGWIGLLSSTDPVLGYQDPSTGELDFTVSTNGGTSWSTVVSGAAVVSSMQYAGIQAIGHNIVAHYDQGNPAGTATLNGVIESFKWTVATTTLSEVGYAISDRATSGNTLFDSMGYDGHDNVLVGGFAFGGTVGYFVNTSSIESMPFTIVYFYPSSSEASAPTGLTGVPFVSGSSGTTGSDDLLWANSGGNLRWFDNGITIVQPGTGISCANGKVCLGGLHGTLSFALANNLANPSTLRGSLIFSDANNLANPSTLRGSLSLADSNQLATEPANGKLSFCYTVTTSNTAGISNCKTSLTIVLNAASSAIGSSDYFSVTYTAGAASKTLNAVTGNNAISPDQVTSVTVSAQSALSNPNGSPGTWCLSGGCQSPVTFNVEENSSYTETLSYTFTPAKSGGNGCYGICTTTTGTGTNTLLSTITTITIIANNTDGSSGPVEFLPGQYKAIVQCPAVTVTTTLYLNISQASEYQVTSNCGSIQATPVSGFVDTGTLGWALVILLIAVISTAAYAKRRSIETTGEKVADEFRKPTGSKPRRRGAG